ncbi:MAG: alpha/beta hydrolase [Leptolyngbyaceae cyanobacterium bins.349]|nr:alpha/beta hydrolase [Leptolyngbyaceae cyanobacterium bins.349]
MPSATVESPTGFYPYQGYACAYDYLPSLDSNNTPPLLLIHPIGVGLSRLFWNRFCQEWRRVGHPHPIYNPDLLGCGASAMPRVAYTPLDWAKQLRHFLTEVVPQPVVICVQGALLPVAIELTTLQPDRVLGLVLCGPPAWRLVTRDTPAWQHRFSWSIFDSPLGTLFYQYARRSQFLRSFSARQLFAAEAGVDEEWLEQLQQGAQDSHSRYAVFSFLAGFWRQDYQAKMAAIAQPTLIVLGDQASSISREGKQETLDTRIADYVNGFPQGESVTIPGRNVLAYESVQEFVAVVAPFVARF